MKTAKGYFDLGYEARQQGLSKEANPLLFGKGWPHEAWNLGYEFAELELNALHQSEAVLERVPANPFAQGKNAAIRGIAFEDCPYGEGPDRTLWECGWINHNDALLEQDRTGLMRGMKNSLILMAGLALCIAFLWAIVHFAPRIEASLDKAQCQRSQPPWKTAECR